MKIKILLSSLLISSLGWGQISTDRPDQTEASVVLPKNMLQIESGFTFQEEEVFNTLFRFGISEKFELRLNTNYLLLDSPDGKNIPSPRSKIIITIKPPINPNVAISVLLSCCVSGITSSTTTNIIAPAAKAKA